jgi:hypothetical protein
LRTLRLTALAVGALVVGLAAPAAGITNGTLDGDDHPFVGLSVIYGAPLEGQALADLEEALGLAPGELDPRFSNPLGRCSGTLMRADLFLTAGHCVTVGPNREDGTPDEGSVAVVWFHSDVDAVRAATGYPFQPVLSDPLVVAGDPDAHPRYDDAAFYLHDLGVIALEEEIAMATYGALPPLGVVDTLATARGQKDLTITAVGYGLQAATANPVPEQIELKEQADRVRYQAALQLKDVKGTAGAPAGTSFTTLAPKGTGTCFGDSGGPNFLGTSNVVAGVTSFGMNWNCGGIGGVYRVDTTDDLEWLATYGLS